MFNPDLYAQTIQNNYPQLKIRSARPHENEGQFNNILIINEAYVFRFPRYPVGLETLSAELTILDSIQGRTTLPIPNPIYRSAKLDQLGQTFMGYHKLPGRGLWRPLFNTIKDEETLQKIADQLAQFLRGLHNIPLESLDRAVPRCDTLAEWQTMFTEFQDYLFPHMREDARSAVSHHFENYFNDPVLLNFPLALRHGDFGTGNILYDSQFTTITGIIDFGFAGIGDPAVDIASIHCFGSLFVQRLVNCYPEIETMRKRAHFYKGTYALQEALHGVKTGDQNAFNSGIATYR